jgi:hypothetical protein
MKTVVMGIFCASRGKYLRKCLLPLLEKPFGKVVLIAFFLFLWAFFTIFPGFPDIFTGSASGRFLLKIKLIVIPGLLYGFSKYPLV